MPDYGHDLLFDTFLPFLRRADAWIGPWSTPSPAPTAWPT
jgi:hypothetical protein